MSAGAPARPQLRLSAPPAASRSASAGAP